MRIRDPLSEIFNKGGNRLQKERHQLPQQESEKQAKELLPKKPASMQDLSVSQLRELGKRFPLDRE